MAKHIIKLYPVGNGDTTLLKLSDDTTILLDCKIRDCEEDTNGNKVYDVKSDLLEEAQESNSNKYIDLFILSHHDLDHCLGFDRNFYTGNPENYSNENCENNEIIVNELWITSLLFNDPGNEDAKALKKEAERRRKLWEIDDPKKSDNGNRIRMIGYDGNERFKNVPNSIPGDLITIYDINGNNTGTFEFFVHGPFKNCLIEANADNDCNSSSIILQARFKESSSEDWGGFFLSGGDADHYRWREVVNKSRKYDNEDKLVWDIFQTPHHCSWTFFNDVPYDQNNNAQSTSLEVLDYGTEDAFIVASSRKIVKEEPNPPHQAAKDEYVQKVKSCKFLNTNTHGDEKEPSPIIFEISNKDGVKKVKSKEEKMTAASVIASKSVMSGNWGK